MMVHSLKWNAFRGEPAWTCVHCGEGFDERPETLEGCPGREDRLTVQDFVDLGVPRRTAQGYLCGTPKGHRPVPAYMLLKVWRNRQDQRRKVTADTLWGWFYQLESLAKDAGRLIG